MLSSGLSNDLGGAMGKIGTVQQQIDALKGKGVTDIRLLGVGQAASLAGVNDALQALAGKNPGVTFTGPIQAGPDGIHPATQAGYKGLGQTSGISGAPSAPPTPQQSPADYYRANYDALSEQVRAQAQAQAPDDPQFADLAVSRVQAKMGSAIRQQTESYKADNDTILQAVNGDFSKGTMPTRWSS